MVHNSTLVSLFSLRFAVSGAILLWFTAYVLYTSNIYTHTYIPANFCFVEYSTIYLSTGT